MPKSEKSIELDAERNVWVPDRRLKVVRSPAPRAPERWRVAATKLNVNALEGEEQEGNFEHGMTDPPGRPVPEGWEACGPWEFVNAVAFPGSFTYLWWRQPLVMALTINPRAAEDLARAMAEVSKNDEELPGGGSPG